MHIFSPLICIVHLHEGSRGAATSLFFYKKKIFERINQVRKYAFKSKDKGFRNSRPDIDNLLKFLIDAMKGLIYQDDSQIVCLNTAKINAEEDFIDIKLIIGK